MVDPRPRDEGTIAILVLGCVVLVLVLLMVVADVTAVVIARRDLVSAADGAAIAAAQEVDVQAYYGGDSSGAIPLDEHAARAVGRNFVRAGDEVRITVSADGTSVTVVIRRRADLPFDHFGLGDPIVTARATARTPIR